MSEPGDMAPHISVQSILYVRDSPVNSWKSCESSVFRASTYRMIGDK
jgi:hypothetical protein